MEAHEKIFEKVGIDFRGEDPGQTLQVALSLLQPQEARVIRLRFGLNEYQEEFSPAAIADRLGIPQRRVTHRLASGLKKLRENLGSVKKTCKYAKCGKEFGTNNKKKQYCSRKCQIVAYKESYSSVRVQRLSGIATKPTHLRIMRRVPHSPTQGTPCPPSTPQIAKEGETMKFLEEQSHVRFIKFNARVSNIGTRHAKLTFCLDLKGGLKNAVPSLFEVPLSMMLKDSRLTSIKVDEELKNQTVEIRLFEEEKKANLIVHGVTLSKFLLSRDETGIDLCFSADVPLDRETGPWATAHLGDIVWAQVFDTQRELDMPPGSLTVMSGGKKQNSKKGGAGKP